MAITLNLPLFRTLIPEFSVETDTTVQAVADEAVKELNEAVWGNLASRGLIYLTAHIMKIGKLAAAGSATGPVTSQKVGDLARGFAATADADQYDSTPYGKEYKRLRKTRLATAIIPDPEDP